MKKTIAILALAVVGITTVNAGVHFGINLGIPLPVPTVAVPAPVVVASPAACEPPPMPAPFVETVPVCPTPGYVWVGGTWGWHDNHWIWARGHWGPPVHVAHLDHGFRAEHHDGFHGGYHRDGHR